MPAGAPLAPGLHRAAVVRRGASLFDLWAMRTLGTITALCFIALLVLLLRVFI